MILDMMRNHFGRIAIPSTIQVRSLFDTEKKPTVWPMTFTVTSETRAPILEIFRALFPSASVTGAPKVRIMQITAGLKKSPLGLYIGAIGYVHRVARDSARPFGHSPSTKTAEPSPAQAEFCGTPHPKPSMWRISPRPACCSNLPPISSFLRQFSGTRRAVFYSRIYRRTTCSSCGVLWFFRRIATKPIRHSSAPSAAIDHPLPFVCVYGSIHAATYTLKYTLSLIRSPQNLPRTSPFGQSRWPATLCTVTIVSCITKSLAAKSTIALKHRPMLTTSCYGASRAM